jgi:NO-binding membrane sensor protein with MHYT domain
MDARTTILMGNYDYRLVGLSILIAVFAAYVQHWTSPGE